MIKSSPATARKRRAEFSVAEKIRAKVEQRDGYCRIGKNLLAGMGPCGGPSEWTHLGDKRRCHTRKMAPELRHTTAGTAMTCGAHHDLYDAHAFTIEPLTSAGADGPLRFHQGERIYDEPPDVCLRGTVGEWDGASHV